MSRSIEMSESVDRTITGILDTMGKFEQAERIKVSKEAFFELLNQSLQDGFTLKMFQRIKREDGTRDTEFLLPDGRVGVVTHQPERKQA